MRAVIWGPRSDQFSLTEISRPEPRPSDVLVRVLACGLNPVDAKIAQWHKLVGSMPSSWVGGLDVAGEIVATGSAVSGWSPGDRVLYHGDMFRPHGGFADFAMHDARTLLPLPAGIAPEVAAATPCAAWTAWRALVDKLHIQQCDSLFIAGGSGGVGSFAIQLARHFGVKTIITTCSAGNHDYVRALGATHAIDYRTEAVQDSIMSLTGGFGVQAALDCVGGDNDMLCASVLGFDGQMVELVSVVRPECYPDAFMNGLSFHQLSLGSAHRHGARSRQQLVAAGKAVGQLLESGELTVPRLKTVALEEVPRSLVAMRSQRTVGKLVMVNQ